MTLRAYAKINIGLHILGKRSDSFHDVETVFHEINMFDEIDLELHDKLAINTDSILVPMDESNLCFRAAQASTERKKHSTRSNDSIKKKYSHWCWTWRWE